MLIVLYCTSNVYAQETLNIMTEDGPPHMIQASDSGIDLDITSEVLESLGYNTRMHYAPLTRAKFQVTQGKADVTVPTFYAKDSDGFYLSKPVIDYRPTVFTLASYPFKNLSDIKGLRVRSFQGATGYFGPEFVNMTQKNRYVEVPNMETLVRMLVSGRVDVVVLDYYIFYYYLTNIGVDEGETPILEHNLIPAIKASVGFSSKALRDKFDQAFQVFQQQDKISKIIERYIGQRSHLANNE